MESPCKKCRRAGEKLFLKGERCFTPKCAVTRKPYAPGIHGAKARRGRKTEYGLQLQEKQRVRLMYGMGERQFRDAVEYAVARKTNVILSLVQALESRLDNVVFRLGFAVSRSVSRQMVSHGHVRVNGKRVTIASYAVRKNEVITLDPKALQGPMGAHLDVILERHTPPAWLTMDKATKSGLVMSPPVADDVMTSRNFGAIIEYYSR